MVPCIVRPMLFGVAATLLGQAVAVSGPWEQCGGIGFSGDVDCATGYTCVVQNDFYSQCISSDAAPRSSTRKPTSTLVTSVKVSSSAKASSAANVSSPVKSTATASPSTGKATCTSTFAPISASAFVAAMSPGWNLGNTLDAVQNEGDWNNPPVVASTFDDIKASGIKGVRLPVTWAYHFTSQSPTWTVDPAWLQRVSDVVDMITSRGFYTIVNVHHDSWVWADVTASSANITAIEERFYKLWYQIGTKLACKGSQVAFESINEPPGTTAEHGAEINKLNTIFLQAINDAGGFNAKRVVTLVGAGEDSIKTSQWFKAPDAKFTNPWAIQYHYYSPYDFTFAAWGKTTWGSATDKAALDSDLAAIRGNFTDIPLIIGEWSATTIFTEAAARWKYYDALVRAAGKYKTGIVLWDNGIDQFERTTHTWRDPVALSILLNAANGTPNVLPESTTDGGTSQTSSAYVFHRRNASVQAVTLGFELNGNTLVSASLGTKQLTRGTEYAVSGKDVTFSAAFLSTILPPGTAPGPGGTITLGFSAGAALAVQVVEYATPVLGATSSKAPATSTDILIPVAWAGVPRVAAVRAVTVDGAILVDDWTQWLPELQRGRLTYSNHWDWDATHVILKAGVVDAVKAAGKSVVFTFEFWPREAGNVANYTLTV